MEIALLLIHYLQLHIQQWISLAFGLLSGYLKIDRPHHNASLLKIILQTAFWCLLITVVCIVAFNVRTTDDITNYTFSFLGDRLWYITCYFFVFIIDPFLNVIGSKVSKTGYRKLLIILGILMSVLTTFCIKGFFPCSEQRI